MVRSERGFSIAELMSVVALLGVLVAIAVPVYQNARDKAAEAVVMENIEVVNTKVQLRMQEGYEMRWRPSRSRWSPDQYLSRRIEVDLTEGAETDSNVDGIRNPVSGNENVLNRGSVNTRRYPTPPAVFITQSNSYRYDRIRQNQRRLAGTIIVHFNRREETIDVFYVDPDGVKSETLYRTNQDPEWGDDEEDDD